MHHTPVKREGILTGDLGKNTKPMKVFFFLEVSILVANADDTVFHILIDRLEKRETLLIWSYNTDKLRR